MNEFWTNYVIGDNTKTYHNSSFYVEYDKNYNNADDYGGDCVLARVLSQTIFFSSIQRSIKRMTIMINQWINQNAQKLIEQNILFIIVHFVYERATIATVMTAAKKAQQRQEKKYEL